MQKLIIAYQIARNAQTARRMLSYLNKHPMAECMLSADEIATVALARNFLKE